MRDLRRAGMAALVLIAVGTPWTAHGAPSIVKVELSDPSSDGHLHTMQIRLSSASVHAGVVDFDVHNNSPTLVHEMVIVRLEKPGQRLPYDPKSDEVVEDQTRKLGEVSDLDPLSHGTLRLNLQPGTYALLCNRPGHFYAGMQAMLTVVP